MTTGPQRPPVAPATAPLALGDYVLVCDKPAGVTSHDVVASIRRRLPRSTKVGHAGTLDPFATGLLLVLVGRGTRVQRFLMALPKRYEVIARFGAVSSTGDPEGEIVDTGRFPEGALTLPTGTISQRPPAYSAVKVGGRRAYQLARAGQTVELAPREVTVHRFEQRWHERDRRAFTIECSSGTYVRSLIADLGDAYCEQLRRTAIGSFDVDTADPDRPIALIDALAFLPAVALDGDQGRRIGHGQTLTTSEVTLPEPAAGASPIGDRLVDGGRAAVDVGSAGEHVRLVDVRGLVAIGAVDRNAGTVRATVGLRGGD